MRARLESDRQTGFLPFLLVATAGTTGAGVVDPLEEAGVAAREFDLWYHVDAAWGGAAALSARLRHHLSGIERADSVTLDAHKWLSVPVGAGMFFTRHRTPVDRTFSTSATYVPDLVRDGRIYPMYTTMQWSRRCTGLKLFMMIAVHGIDGIAARIEHQALFAEVLRARLSEAGLQLVNDTPLPVVCFTHPVLESEDMSHDDVAHRLRADQLAWISKVRLANGVTALRAQYHELQHDRIRCRAACRRPERRDRWRVTSLAPWRTGSAAPRLAETLDWTTLVLVPGEHRDDSMTESRTDLLFSVRVHDRGEALRYLARTRTNCRCTQLPDSSSV